MVKGITKTGFRFTVKENIGDDWELIEQLSEVESNPLVCVGILKKLLGNQQYNALKSHIKKKFGKVTTKQMMLAFNEIMQMNEQTKK